MSPQEQFDKKYISSTEIMKDLNISRTSLCIARKSGKLPDAILLNNGQLVVWERARVADYIAAWKLVLQARRNG